MIRVTPKITETDQERIESLRYIQSLNEDKSYLAIKDPYGKPNLAKKGKHMSGVFTEE